MCKHKVHCLYCFYTGMSCVTKFIQTHTCWSYFQLSPLSQWSPAKSVGPEVDWVTWEAQATVAKFQFYHHALQYARACFHHPRNWHMLINRTPAGGLLLLFCMICLSAWKCWVTLTSAFHLKYWCKHRVIKHFSYKCTAEKKMKVLINFSIILKLKSIVLKVF